MRIIIVEDEQRARRGLKHLLQMASDDCEIIADVSDGDKAVALIEMLKPDVVFTDIKMPAMDGLMLIKKVRNLGIHTQFVIVSAYEEFEFARKAVSLGVTEYLVKPLIMDDIENVIKKLQCTGDNLTEKNYEPIDLSSQYPDTHILIKKALKYIEKEYAKKINQKELASQLGISQEYFSSLFTKEVGESFTKVLNKYRVGVAKTMLLNTDISREQICECTGFTDKKYFDKVFREITGMSVTMFLREHGKSAR